MTEELVALLRYRVATRFYDQAPVIDAIARAIRASGLTAEVPRGTQSAEHSPS